MSDKNLDEIRNRKKELEAELDRIQHELDDSIDDMRHEVSNSLRPVELIKKYPLSAVGLSLFVGFLAGHQPKTTSKSSLNSSEDGFSSLLFSELKKLATRKALMLATDYLEEFLDAKKSELVNGLEKKEGDEE